MRIVSFTCGLLIASAVQGQCSAGFMSFGSGANAFSMEFVEIGDPGNAPDMTGSPNPAGSVGYTYSIGKHEVSRDMVRKADAAGKLGITLADMSSFGGNGANRPATGVNWYEAARFINYLNTSQGFLEAYKFDSNGNFQLWVSGDAGYDASNPFRNGRAKFVLPSTDEWYKAAFYDGNGGYSNYAIGNASSLSPVASGTGHGEAVYQQMLSQGPADITLAGGLSFSGTMGQSGNVWEWLESTGDSSNSSDSSLRSLRGGFWSDQSVSLSSSHRLVTAPASEGVSIGFRVATLGATASVPEPSSLAIWAALGFTAIAHRRRKLMRR